MWTVLFMWFLLQYSKIATEVITLPLGNKKALAIIIAIMISTVDPVCTIKQLDSHETWFIGCDLSSLAGCFRWWPFLYFKLTLVIRSVLGLPCTCWTCISDLTGDSFTWFMSTFHQLIILWSCRSCHFSPVVTSNHRIIV